MSLCVPGAYIRARNSDEVSIFFCLYSMANPQWPMAMTSFPCQFMRKKNRNGKLDPVKWAYKWYSMGGQLSFGLQNTFLFFILFFCAKLGSLVQFVRRFFYCISFVSFSFLWYLLFLNFGFVSAGAGRVEHVRICFFHSFRTKPAWNFNKWSHWHLCQHQFRRRMHANGMRTQN